MFQASGTLCSPDAPFFVTVALPRHPSPHRFPVPSALCSSLSRRKALVLHPLVFQGQRVHFRPSEAIDSQSKEVQTVLKKTEALAPQSGESGSTTLPSSCLVQCSRLSPVTSCHQGVLYELWEPMPALAFSDVSESHSAEGKEKPSPD